MTKNELAKLAQDTARNVLSQNADTLAKEISQRFNANAEDSRIELHDALGRIVNLMLGVIPEISATVTAQMLVDLDLVSLDDQ